VSLDIDNERMNRCAPSPVAAFERALGLVACLALWLLASASPARAQRVLSEVRPQQAWLGQEIRYYVQVRGAREANAQAPAVDGLTIELLEQGITNQSTQVTIVNGRRQVTESADYIFVYSVRAARPGRYEFPLPQVEVDGETLRAGRASVLVVADPSQDDRAFVQVSSEPPTLVLGQDGKLIVDVFLKHPPAGLGSKDPLDIYDRGSAFSFFDQGTPPPTLRVPWIQERLQGMGEINLDAWVQARGVQRGGLQIAGARGRFVERGQTEDIQRAGADGTEQSYRRYRYTLPVTAEVAGSYELPPAVLEGALVAVEGQDRYVWKEGFARSEPLRFDVIEPPRDGRPASFGGAVGAFTLEMEPPSPTQVRVGDPVFVTLVARGVGFLKGVPFDLAAQLGDAFRVERVGVTESLPAGASRPAGFPDRPGQWRQWDFKVFPVRADVAAIPALEFAWFDPDARVYRTATTAAVPIAVTEAASGPEVLVGSGGTGTPRRAVELVATAALSANVTDLNLLGNQTPRPGLWLAGLGALPLLYGGLAFVVGRRRRLLGDPALLRRSRAWTRARTRLQAAESKTGVDALRDAHAAFRGLAADLTDGDEGAITHDELVAFLAARAVDPAGLGAVEELGAAVEAARYGGGSATGLDVPALLRGLGRVVDGLRASARLLLLAGWALGSIVATGNAGVAAQDTAAFQTAQADFERGEYAAAARGFEAMLEGGYENGYVLYDLGNAWFRAGELGRAIAAYRRAQLYLPSDANLEVHLRRALDARPRPLSPPAARSLADYVLFWRGRISCRAEFAWALGLGVVAFAAALVRLLRSGGSGLRMVAWPCAVASVLLAVSGWLDAQALAARAHGVLVAPDTVLRTGPGETFEPRYEQGLGEGAELAIRERRDGWFEVLAGGQYEGWLPAESVATW
jgi:tetratricopeptide (TPR) repeat protein